MYNVCFAVCACDTHKKLFQLLDAVCLQIHRHEASVRESVLPLCKKSITSYIYIYIYIYIYTHIHTNSLQIHRQEASVAASCEEKESHAYVCMHVHVYMYVYTYLGLKARLSSGRRYSDCED